MADGNGSAEAKGHLSRETMDAWENLTTGLGRANRDKREGGRVKTPPIFIDEQTASDIYHGDDLAQQIADVPPKEMLRQGITIKIEKLGGTSQTRTEEQKQQDSETLTKVTKDTTKKLKSLNAAQMLLEAKVWARVFGGAMMFLGVDDGLSGDPKNLEKPLDPEKIRSFTFLKVFNRFEVSVARRYDKDGGEKVGEPSHYTLQPRSSSGGVNAETASIPIHETRFLRFDGVLTSRERRVANDGWSDSIYLRMEDLLRDFGLTWAGVAHLMQDFSQAIFKMRGLKAALASDKDNLVIDRMIIMDMCRSLARAVPIDAEGEDFERKATPMSGLPETLDRFASRLATAAKMPMTLLFGQSPGGLNATGDSDIRLFYDRISSDQEMELRPLYEQLIEFVFLSQDGPTNGKVPEQWSMTFNALWQMTQKEKAELQKTTAEADAINIDRGIYTADEASQSHYGGDEFSTDVTLDTETRDQIKEVDKQLAAMSPEELAKLDPDVPEATPAADPQLDPASGSSGTATTPGGEDPVIEAAVALNGAQVTALLDVINRVANKLLPREVGVNVIANAFNLDPALVENMFGVVGSSFFVEQETAPAASTNRDQAPPHHTHWDPEQNDLMGPETVDPVTGEHVHERPGGTLSLPARTGVPHRHDTPGGPSGADVPWFATESEEREFFVSQISGPTEVG